MPAKRVPAALHSELTEYASLLRALRTRDTQDLTTHLNKVTTAEQTEGRKRDHWTRWPLLLEDVAIPEWTLEDEVAVIASQVMKARRRTTTFPVFEHDEDDPDHPFYVPYLTSVIGSLLSKIFSLLAEHTPSRPASMQNRIEPLNWRSVIGVLVACDVLEYSKPKVVENVIRRMEAIYGPSFSPFESKLATSYRDVERMKNKKATTERMHKILEGAMTSCFSQPSPPPYRSSSLSSPKRRRGHKLSLDERNYKVRKPQAKRRQMEYDEECQGHSEVSQEPVRSTRAKSKLGHDVLDE